jgi:selenocysteine lyase/cysteine desulfurase
MRRRLTDGLPGPLLAPDDALGSMAAVPIRLPAGTSPGALQDRVLRDGWEVPIVELPAGSRFPTLIRVSAHLYNRADEVDQLAAKLRSLGVTLGE